MVYVRSFACVTDTVSVAIFLIFVRLSRAVVAFIADPVAIAVILAVTGYERTFVNAIHQAVAVVIDIGNAASADAGFCFGEIVGAEVDDIAVRSFVVFVGFRFRLWFGFRFFVGNFRVSVAYDSIGKFFFVRFFLNTVFVRKDGLRVSRVRFAA